MTSSTSEGPSTAAVKHNLSRDVFLQLAGMEASLNLGPIDLHRLARDVAATRDSGVFDRLRNSLGLSELLASGDELTIKALEQRLPHARVLITYFTASALADAWDVLSAHARAADDDDAPK